MRKILPKGVLALTLILLATLTSLAEPQTYALEVDGLACPFCAFGIEKQLRKIDGVDKLDTDIKAGVILLTMKEGFLLDEKDVRQAIKQAGFSLRGLEKVKNPPQKTGESK